MLSCILIIIGIVLLNMQNIIQFSYEKEVEDEKDDFIEFKDTEENNYLLDLLYQRLLAENISLYENDQSNLKDPFSYEQPSIDLTEYGIDDNVIGYINIPKMSVELPILLGANSINMKKGAVHLTETSYPIGGENTNSVIAAHRGWSTGLMFRHIELLEIGDIIYIQNYWNLLEYEVYDIEIINPTDVENLLIEDDKEILTLLTCHPYRVNSQRYMVKAKLVDVK